MLVAIKPFRLNGVKVEPGQKVAGLHPRLRDRLVSTHRLREVEEATPVTSLIARRVFTWQGKRVLPGDVVPNVSPEKRMSLIRAEFVLEGEPATPKAKATPKKRTKKHTKRSP